MGLIYQNDLTEKVALLSMATIGTRLLVHSKRLTPWRHPLYIYSTGVGKIMPCTEHLQCAICSRFQLYYPLDGAEPSPYPPHLILKYCSVLYQRSGDCIGPSLSGTKNKKKSDLNLLPKCFIMLKNLKKKVPVVCIATSVMSRNLKQSRYLTCMQNAIKKIKDGD